MNHSCTLRHSLARLLLGILIALHLYSSGHAAEAWKDLFDGKTLNGWTQYGGKATYRVENGLLIGTTVTNTPNSFLCTTRSFTNFILEVEFKADEGVNSGVQIRSHVLDTPTTLQYKDKTIKIPAGRVHGLQAEIDTSVRAWSAGLYEEGARGWLKDLKENEPARKAFRHNDWNQYRIEAKGDSIKTWINGVLAAQLQDSRVMSGFIGLQVHGVGQRPKPLEIRFRMVRIQEL